ncbi:MAG: N-6 DNA methylase [Lachnospiraceae bacterium]|nr:N-6 DNA methylase [Lachnospiraceae bacterium]
MSLVRDLSEDEVRDGYTDKNGFHKGAKQILEFDKPENNVQQGTGQLTTFKKLGFVGKGSNHKPDGWYLPADCTDVAIILETKSSDKDIESKPFINELLDNVKIANNKYPKVIGILYNGKETKIFLNEKEKKDATNILQSKQFYKSLFNDFEIDTQQIYLTTMKINNLLHYKFGVNDYYDRMVFTACALVAKRFGAPLAKGMSYSLFHFTILDTLSKSLEKAKKQNEKLEILLESYSRVQMNITNNQKAIDDFIDNIEIISELINSKNWNGEDVMGIFFNEFNRYKGKSENGQVFTPDHVTSLMYRLINVNPRTDRILDAACGSGAFLTKAMSNMIKAVGGPETNEAAIIMSTQLYGIEIDKRIFSLACANMLIHKDGKTNLEQMDTITQEAYDWIKSKKITKVLMNPPYERKCHPEVIIKNVLNSVKQHTISAFLLPDKKLEKVSQKVVKDILKEHRLLKIIKLPEKTFDEGITTSIFIFESGVPQNDEEIFTCYIKEDGLERVKNQGRQDVRHRWKEIEDKWVDIIKKQNGDDSIKWIKPKECLSYQKDEEPFGVNEEDFTKTMIDYLMFKEEIDVKALKDVIANKIIYFSNINSSDKTDDIIIEVERGEKIE